MWNMPEPEWNEVCAQRVTPRRDPCKGVVVPHHQACHFAIRSFSWRRRVLEVELDPKIRVKVWTAQGEEGRRWEGSWRKCTALGKESRSSEAGLVALRRGASSSEELV